MKLPFFRDGSRLGSALRLSMASLFLLIALRPAAAQWTPADAQAAFSSYNNAFYFSTGGDSYEYALEQGATSATGFWVDAEQIEMAVDAYNQDPTAANATIINQLCNGFIAQFGSDWSGDTFDDDLMWATIAFVRAYTATGTSTWLTDAETNFTTVWNRGYDTTFGGGIWWNVATKTYKNSAANWTFVIAGNLLSSATGESTYLNEANTIYAWAYSTLYDASTGEVYDGIGTGGLSTGQYSYNYGVSIGADYLESRWSDATSAATYLMSQETSATVGGFNILPNYGQGGQDGSGFNGIALRWVAYAYAHGAISNSSVLAWAQTNVGLAWAQRNAAGLSWNNWSSSTPDSGLYSWDCSNTLVGMLDVPNSPAATNDFSLTASPADLSLTPGSNGSSSITLTPSSGFTGPVTLTAAVIGSPAGVSATLSSDSIPGAGSVVLDVSAGPAARGGSYVVAVTASGGGVSHTAFVRAGLPYFSLSLSPLSTYLDENGSASATVTIAPHNGFDGTVQFSRVAGLPEGVGAWFEPGAGGSTATLRFRARAGAGTSAPTSYAISGSTASYSQTISPGSTLAVSAARGGWGAGIPVDLSSAFNVTGIYADGSTYSTGAGLDGLGYSLSSKVLTGSRVLDHTQFRFGPPGQPDAVYGAGGSIPLPPGRYTALRLLAVGINGGQSAQTVTVSYADGTSSQFTQSFSDWFANASYPNEAEGLAMPYRNYADGTTDNAQFNLYAYTLLLDPARTVKSLTPPDNRNVVVLAATLTLQEFGEPVDLSSAYNAVGIYSDGTTFPTNGGLDGGGTAYSATQLGDAAGASSRIVNDVRFSLAAPNGNNVLYGTGQPVGLPAGHFSLLRILGTGVEGSQAGQTVTVTYTDGTTDSFTQGFSDWFTPQGYPREYRAQTLSYRDVAAGGQSSATFYLYDYVFPLNERKVVQSVTLPANRHVVALAISLTREAPEAWPGAR